MTHGRNRFGRCNTDLKGWTTLSSDISWEDYHGMWCRYHRDDNAWYVLQWTNLVDVGGKEFKATPYECQVKRLSFGELEAEDVAGALRSAGFRVAEDDGQRCIVSDYGDIIAKDDGQSNTFNHIRVECCIQHGLGAPLETFTGRVRPRNIRAEAKRYAELCMKDAKLREERLERPVNAIGSTAREYGNGDVNAALYRGENTVAKQVLKKMMGVKEP